MPARIELRPTGSLRLEKMTNSEKNFPSGRKCDILSSIMRFSGPAWFPPPLRIMIPFLLIGGAAFLFFFNSSFIASVSSDWLEKATLTAVALKMSELQENIETELQHGNFTDVQHRISISGSDPRVSELALIDDRGTVVCATSPGVIGRPFEAALPEIRNDLMRSAISAGGGKVSRAEDGSSVSAYYPVNILSGTAGARSPRTGSLYMRYDLSQEKRYYRALIRRRILFSIPVYLLLVLALYIFIKMIFGSRTHRMVAVAQRLASGDLSVRVGLRGRDELADLSRSIDAMTEKLERDKAELIAGENRYRHLFENAPDGIFLTEPDGRLVLINPAGARIFGFDSVEEMLGAEIDAGKRAYVDPEIRTDILARLENQDTVFVPEVRMFRKGGMIFWAMLTIRAIRNKEGVLLQMESLLTDITDRKKAEEERTKYREESARQEKLAVLGQLAGSVSHELRNPLIVMDSAVNLLEENLSGAEELTSECLGTLRKEIANSTRIISDMLDFVRTKAPHAETVSVVELFRSGLARCRIPETVEVVFEIPPDLPPVRVDPAQIGQVLQNLIMNAVQAMSESGELRLGAAAIINSGAPDAIGSYIRIRVIDTGTGITPENMGRMFQPLFTTKTKGIGLGLVVCKNLVEANGGRIAVESMPGLGTVFSVDLPV